VILAYCVPFFKRLLPQLKNRNFETKRKTAEKRAKTRYLRISKYFLLKTLDKQGPRVYNK